MIDWVCPECGIDYATLTVAALPDRAASFPARWRVTLAGVDDGVLRHRPAPETWSPIEYAAHTADVVRQLTETLGCMVEGSDPPAFGDPDEEVVERRYAQADLAAVLDGMQAETDALVSFLDTLTPEIAARETTFPWGARDVQTIAGNAVHEQAHHLFDVQRILAGRDRAGGGNGSARA
jgi:hypothetical protein